MTAQRNIYNSQNDMEMAMNRLSSGLRINNSWEDPTNLGISERYRAQIGGMQEAEKNAHYNVNLLATAEGAMQVVDEKLLRMRSIAVQSSNGALTGADRKVANVEFQQLKSEITRIANVTHYNGLKLIDGSFSSTDTHNDDQQRLDNNFTSVSNRDNALKFHIGANNVQGQDYYYVNIGDMRADALGIGDTHVADTASAQIAIEALDEAINSKDTARTFVGSLVERLQNTITELQISQERAQASESTIRDADIAAEMANFTRSQILQQTSISMTSQANMIPSMIAGLVG
jgi:flagellin